MAYIKILNIKKMSHVFHSIEYVENEEKTNASARQEQFPADGSGTSDSGSIITGEREGIEIGEENADIRTAITNLVGYTTNGAKTADRTLVTGINCTTHHAAEEMQSLVEFWKKERQITGVSRDAFHIIQSFDPKNNTGLSPEAVHEIGKKYCEALTHMDDKRLVNRRYMMLLSTHVDKVHLHNHIILCSYDMDTGRKFHECKEVYRQMKEASDRLCREYGLNVIEAPDPERARSRGEWKQTKEKASWKDNVRKDIDAMKSISSNWNDFRTYMSYTGYSIREGRYVTYTTQDGHKVRDKTLGREWTKEIIEKSWSLPQAKDIQIKDQQTKNQQTNGPWQPYTRQLSHAELRTRTGNSHTDRTSEAVSSAIARFYRHDEDVNRKRQQDRETGLWDDIPAGKKTTLAMILMMAIEMMKEPDSFRGGIYFSDMRTASSPEKEKDYRVKRLEDALSIAKQEGVKTQEDLKSRLNECGAALSHAKKELKKSREKLNWMEIAINALSDYEQAAVLSEAEHAAQSCRQDVISPLPRNEEGTEKARKAHAVLHRYGCTSPEKAAAFREEYAKLKETTAGHTARVNSLRREYKRLIRLRQSLELAKDNGFLHGGYYQEPQELEKEFAGKEPPRSEQAQAEKESSPDHNAAKEQIHKLPPQNNRISINRQDMI